MTILEKDAVLDSLAEEWNIAQFVSYSPSLTQRFSRIKGLPRNFTFPSPQAAIGALLSKSPERSVNIRTYSTATPRGSVFKMNLRSVDEIMKHLEMTSRKGLFSILNESIDVNDGGVSGVSLGGTVEFAPGDTPRCVEREDVTALPSEVAWSLFDRVYSLGIQDPFDPRQRVEFSVHPFRRGFRSEPIIVWQQETIGDCSINTPIQWPHAFSRFVGDKVFGLLLADVYGYHVPWTQVIARNLPPFSFGKKTGASVPWIRTAPKVKVPGKFTTHRGWKDPFEIVFQDELTSSNPGMISSVLIQDEVPAIYSGGSLTQVDQSVYIEAKRGFSDRLMLGEEGPDVSIRRNVRDLVEKTHLELMRLFGSVRVEWAYFDSKIWILQLQQEEAISKNNIIVPGNPIVSHDFNVREGLESLRLLVQSLKDTQEGINLVGDIGMTSHMADILREYNIPSRRLASQRSLFDTDRE